MLGVFTAKGRFHGHHPGIQKQFDVVLYGASGFVGRQTVAYFAQQPHVTALGLKWAISGALCGQAGGGPQGSLDQRQHGHVLVAEAQDAAAMDRLARNAPGSS
jgi:hypothetical protein